jgi:hypothetical protein
MKQLSLLESARLADPTRSDPEHIEQIAADLIRDLDERAPVSLEVVAAYRGIDEIRVVPLPVSGVLAPGDGGLRMLLNNADGPRRRRFTGFHEVGHSFQPGYRTGRHYRCTTTSLPRFAQDPEVLSDSAAAALLMPERLFAPDVLATSFGLDAVHKLADAYQASVQATMYRFQRHWPEPRLSLLLEHGLRKDGGDDPEAQTKLRVVSAHAAGEWPFVPRNKSAADGGALARAYAGEVIREPASLAELGVSEAADLQVSARCYTYGDSGGELRRRVLALYRRCGRLRGAGSIAGR